MKTFFFDLSERDKEELFRAHSDNFRMSPMALEKDVWICWILEQLFQMPNRKTMAFKGGTSLSKVYKVINRFSEDVDITLDYRDLGEPLTGTESRTRLQKKSDELKLSVLEHVRDVIKPYLESRLNDNFKSQAWNTSLSDDGEKLFIQYPSIFDSKDGYIGNVVLLEFGGRNITEPNQPGTISPYLSEATDEVIFPTPEITVLAKERTFWEKATLVHVECRRPVERSSIERISRHWYDLYMMSKDLSFYESMEGYELLKNVVNHKKQFFHYSFADYDSCLTGGLHLIPANNKIKNLIIDFIDMEKAGMFFGAPPQFPTILKSLSSVESQLNEHFKKLVG